MDLLVAFGLGFIYATPQLLQGTYFIPTPGVPLLLVTHAALFVLLGRRSRAAVSVHA